MANCGEEAGGFVVVVPPNLVVSLALPMPEWALRRPGSLGTTRLVIEVVLTRWRYLLASPHNDQPLSHSVNIFLRLHRYPYPRPHRGLAPHARVQGVAPPLFFQFGYICIWYIAADGAAKHPHYNINNHTLLLKLSFKYMLYPWAMTLSPDRKQ